MENKINKVCSYYLVDDNKVFETIFQASSEILTDFIQLKVFSTMESAEQAFKEDANLNSRPKVVFVTSSLIGSSYDGIELIRKINFEYGNNVIIGIISDDSDLEQIAKAKKVGAQF
jgi:hypothetical protein